MSIECQISLGELVDKITILEIKELKIKESEKLILVSNEKTLLLNKLKMLDFIEIENFKKELFKINLELWEIEDKIRLLEKLKKFDQEFIEVARSVYLKNDERFLIKNLINKKYNSKIVEVKSFEY